MIYQDWRILRIDGCYKLFGSTKNTWNLNSGIVRVEDMSEYYLVHGYSGSVYKITKQPSKILSFWPAAILQKLIETIEERDKDVEVLPLNTDLMKLDYSKV